MGFEQVKAAGMHYTGAPGSLIFESFPNTGQVTTYCADNAITDSAAAGTALATGRKVNTNVVSVALPGDGSEYPTLLEYFKARGKMTGLVTTDEMNGATPAAFGAHETNRFNNSQIAADYFTQTRPNVLFGGRGAGLDGTMATDAGYTLVTDRAEMQALDTASVQYVSGQFGAGRMPYEVDGVGGLPHLSEMTITALEVLEKEPKGFFLMVESGNIDYAGHANDISRNIFETVEFSSAVAATRDWAEGRTDTLIIVTADHETGGLLVTANNGIGNPPAVTWFSVSHTAADVPLYAWGVNSELFAGNIDNTNFFDKAVISASGYVKDGGGTAIPDVKLVLSGPSPAETAVGSDGFYELPDIVAFSTYTVTPYLAGWSFSPVSLSSSSIGGRLSGWNFTGTPLPSIRGCVTGSDGSAAEKIRMVLTGKASSSTLTDANGNYAFSGLENGNYKVRPEASGKSFEPAARETGQITSNVSGWDFRVSKGATLLENGGGTVEFPFSGGRVKLLFPEGSFTGGVSISVQKPSSLPGLGGQSAEFSPTGVGIEILKDTAAQPAKDVEITLYYSDADVAGLDETRLLIALYDEASGSWLPLVSVCDPDQNKITALTGHLSVFGLIQANPLAGVSGVRAYPNPFVPAVHSQMRFSSLPGGALLKIYTIAGELAAELRANDSGMAVWNGRNTAGSRVASGVYVCVAESANSRHLFKLAVKK